MSSLSYFRHVLAILLGSYLVILTRSEYVLPRLNNGLAITPPMGWNSYNHYSCSPTEAIIHSNAQALVNLGLQDCGYHFVTVDCGWTLPHRTDGKLTWNPSLFPSGYPALGDFIHALGLGFGVYSDGGIQMCMTGSPAQAGSLGNETLDAKTFASWGADLVKYDNCYSDAASGYPDTNYAPSTSPSGHYVRMSEAVAATNRPMIFQICDWGIDFPSAWAPALGNSWRITNDIIPAYRTIPRILNQVVPQTSFAGPGHWLDLDMLEVGNNIFTKVEEQTHFSLWAIIKSPLIIGAALKDTHTSINAASLAILKNKDVISYNQDSLGVAASFRRRWTKEGYEVWAGALSGDRVVVALINLNNVARTLTLNLPDVGIQKAGTVKDIWNNVTTMGVLTSYSAPVGAHGTMLLELSETTAAGQYNVKDAVPSGKSSNTTAFTKIYGVTSSANYNATVSFPSSSPDAVAITINSASYTIPASSQSITVPISLNAANNNNISVTSPITPSSLSVSPPTSSFYPCTSFTTSGKATKASCHTGLCIPVGSKIQHLSPSASASINIASPSKATGGTKYTEVYFLNNDIAFSTSWDYGTNTRNLTVTVNSITTRIEVPLSGRSSELFSPGLGWEDTGIFGVLTDGWVIGANSVSVGNTGGANGLVSSGADFVGLSVLW